MKKYRILLFLLTLLIQLPMLLNHGVFWDDWTIFNMNYEGLVEQYLNNGSHYFGISHIHNYILSFLNPILIYRWLLLAIILAINLLFLETLVNLKLFSSQNAFIVSVIFCVAPFCFAKIDIINLIYQIMLLFFLLGAWFLSLYLKYNKIIFRIFSLICFFYSFATNSIILFYSAILLYLCVDYFKSHKISVPNAWSFFKRNFDYILIPIIFVGLRYTLIKPSGYYAYHGYNEIQSEHIKGMPREVFSVHFGNLVDLCKMVLKVNSNLIVLITTIVVLLGFIVIVYVKRQRFNTILNTERKTALIFLVLGLFLVTLAMIPYMLVGKPPCFRGFDTRHQLLMPIGFSIFCFALISLIPSKLFKFSLLFFVVLFSMEVNLYQHVKFLQGWFKQEAMIAQIPEIVKTEKLNTLEVYDQFTQCNATDADMSHYEFSGIFKFVTHHEDKLFLTKALLTKIENTGLDLKGFIELRRKLRYLISNNITDYTPDGTCRSMYILPGEKRLNDPQNLLGLLTAFHVNHDKFKKEISSYVTLNFVDDCSPRVKRLL